MSITHLSSETQLTKTGALVPAVSTLEGYFPPDERESTRRLPHSRLREDDSLNSNSTTMSLSCSSLDWSSWRTWGGVSRL